MRLTNKRQKSVYVFLNIFLLVSILLSILWYISSIYLQHPLSVWTEYLFIFPVILYFIFYFRGRQIFEYDSDGEALNFSNMNVMPFFDRNIRDEFPKYKLIKYDIISGWFLFKRLYICISSKKSDKIILRYDISYLTRKEIGDLKFSLNKVIKENIQNKQTQA